jgi:putative inorganic carbon (HCO3(-)) transporter
MSHPLIPSGWRSWLPTHLIELGLCLSFVIFFYWQHPPASLLLLAAAAALAWIRLDIAVALLPLTFPYYLFLEPLRSSGSPAFSIGELGLLICLGVAVLRSVLLPADQRATLKWARGLWRQGQPFLLPALIFLIGGSLAVLVAPNIHLSLRAYREEILEPLLYFLLLLRYLRTRADLLRTLAAFMLSALVVAAMGLIQGIFFHADYLVQLNPPILRVRGPYGSANNLALFLDRAVPILLALAFTHLRPRPATPGQSRLPVWRDPLRWLCVLASLPLLLAVYWTDSRGAEVAIGVVLLLIFIFEVRNWIAIAVVVGVGAVGGWLFRAHLIQLFTEGHEGTTSERFTYWKAALLMIRDHFFLGSGPDSFHTLYNPDAPGIPHSPSSYALKALNGQPFPATYDPTISHPHNMLLDFWISTGLLGFAALLWLLAACAFVLGRLYRLCAPLRQGDLLQRLLLGLAGSMIAVIVHGMVDNSYFLPDLSMVFWLLIGSLLIVRGIARKELALARKSGLPPLTIMGQGNDPASSQNEMPITETVIETPENVSD